MGAQTCRYETKSLLHFESIKIKLLIPADALSVALVSGGEKQEHYRIR